MARKPWITKVTNAIVDMGDAIIADVEGILNPSKQPPVRVDHRTAEQDRKRRRRIAALAGRIGGFARVPA
jgi:hypothetical protein